MLLFRKRSKCSMQPWCHCALRKNSRCPSCQCMQPCCDNTLILKCGLIGLDSWLIVGTFLVSWDWKNSFRLCSLCNSSLEFQVTRSLPLPKALLSFEATNGIPPPLRTPLTVSSRLFVMMRRKLFACMLLTGWPRPGLWVTLRVTTTTYTSC